MFVGPTSEDTRPLELDQRRADVLAIGSQLAYGRVGLNASLPVYQEAGLRVASIPTTILSVLPHYPTAHQTRLSVGWIVKTLNDLVHSGALDSLRAIAIGYLANPDQASAIAAWLTDSPLHRLPIIVDPTFGDIGLGFYNDPAIVQPLRDVLRPEATGLTPNVFELAHLTCTDPSDLHDLEAIEVAARQLLLPQTEWIVVSGIRHPAVADQTDNGAIAELVITHDSADLFSHPLLARTPAGVGDTFTASLVTHLIDGTQLTRATQHAAKETAAHIREGDS